jgi:hypothetical protein
LTLLVLEATPPGSHPGCSLRLEKFFFTKCDNYLEKRRNDATGCCDGKLKWPTQLDSIKAVPKGDSWRNWYEKDIEIF